MEELTYWQNKFKIEVSNHIRLNLISYSPSFLLRTGCTAERFFRIDRAQEHLHYVTDIAMDTIFLLDPDGSTPTATATGGQLPTPDTETAAAGALPNAQHHLYHATSSGSSDNLDSRAGTPSSPGAAGRQKNFFQRGGGGSVVSLSPLPGDGARKCSATSDSSQGSPGSDAAEYMRNGARTMAEPSAVNFKR